MSGWHVDGHVPAVCQPWDNRSRVLVTVPPCPRQHVPAWPCPVTFPQLPFRKRRPGHPRPSVPSRDRDRAGLPPEPW